MNKIGIVINPLSKKNRKRKNTLADSYREIMGERAEVRETRSVAELEAAVSGFKNSGIDCIGISGGDGTIHFVISAVMKIYGEENAPPVLLLSDGTMNNVSRSISLKGGSVQILKRFRSLLENGSEIIYETRNTMKINNRYCFLFGAGFVTNFLDEVYSISEKGTLANLSVIFKALSHAFLRPREGYMFKGFEANVYIDEKLLPIKDFSAILAGTVDGIGLGFNPFADAKYQNGKFQVVTTGFKPLEYFRNIYKIRSCKNINHPRFFNFFADSIKMKFDGILKYTMDGDLYDIDGFLVVKTGPSVRFIRV